MVQGGIAFAVFIVAAGLMIWFVPNRWWRLVLVLPMIAAALGYFQAREQTCVRLAATGTQNLDVGHNVENRDPEFVTRTIEQAQKVWAKSVTATLLVMLSLLTLPTA